MKRVPRIVTVGVVAFTLASTGCLEPTLAPAARSDNAALFDRLWHEVDLHYSMFASKGVNWDSVRAVNRPLALEASSDTALARILGNMLKGLHDRHVWLSTSASSSVIAYRSAEDTTPAAFDATLAQAKYLVAFNTTAGAHIKYGRTASNVGYVRIPSFEGSGWTSEIDEALQALGSVRAIVIDVRGNPGGSYGIAVNVAGRFADTKQTFGYVQVRNGPKHDDFTSMIVEQIEPSGERQFRGPVYVLTNRHVYSAAENFVLAMRSLPNVTTIGDTTAGATGKPIVRELPNGWTYQISSWREYTPAGQLYEDVGLAPMVYRQAHLDEIRNGVDVVLQTATDFANNSTVTSAAGTSRP